MNSPLKTQSPEIYIGKSDIISSGKSSKLTAIVNNVQHYSKASTIYLVERHFGRDKTAYGYVVDRKCATDYNVGDELQYAIVSNGSTNRSGQYRLTIRNVARTEGAVVVTTQGLPFMDWRLPCWIVK